MSGRFTIMLFRRQPEDEKPWREHWKTENRLADIAGYPRAFIACVHCGAQMWRMPPHPVGEPCPLMSSLAESTGLQMDTQRNMALRSTAQLEKMMEAFFKQFSEEDES